MNRKPLSGIRVLEIAAYISGPYAATILCGLGAEVVKIEPTEGGDAFRRGQDIRSPYFAQYNAGKKSVAVDLKQASGVGLVKSLLPRFDVLLENMRPGKLTALGLGPDACRAENPHLIYLSISGFGNGGPLRDRPAYDTIGQSMGGLYSIMNDPGDSRLSGTCMADLITGNAAAMGVLAALVGRARDAGGEGGLVETSIFEAVTTLTIDAMTQSFETGEDPTRESRHPQAHNFCLKTASGDQIAVHLSSSEKFWQSLVLAMGRKDLLEDVRFRRYADRVAHFKALQAVLEEEFLKRPADQWEQLLIQSDVPCAPVLGLTQVTSHPQTEWLEMLEPEKNGQTLVRPPWRFGGERPRRSVRPPHLGEHSRQVAAEVLTAAEVDEFLAKRILAQSNAG